MRLGRSLSLKSIGTFTSVTAWGDFDLRFLPPPRPNGQEMRILDLGCGIGFWVSEFAMLGFNNLHASDLT